MRILVVADDLYPGYGGQASSTHGHIEALLALGHEIRVLAGEERQPTSPPPPVSVTRLPVWRPGDKMTHFVRPRRELIAEALDWAEVVHVNTPTPFALMVLMMARHRGVPSAVGFYAQEESTALHFGRGRALITAALRRWYSFFYRQPDCLVVPTAFAKRLAESYTHRPLHTVSCGIYLPARGPEQEARAQVLRGRLLAGGKTRLMAYVGRLSLEKRPEGMIEIAAALAAERSGLLLAIAGTGPLMASMKAQVRRLGLEDEVVFLGYVSEEDKGALLLAADLFIMPSPTELQSIATLEAAARGCAVVVADYASSAVGEWTLEADCGLLYRPDAPEAAARAILGLLGDEARLRRYQDNALALAQRHDVFESGRLLERLYRELTAARSASGVPSGA
ncbi:MAG: glycosyltransferase [Deinococcota bacterium]|jgi:alpha-1,6-mannosyltransferase|nr:glycosyltransferase [Deinococcota bacterium]